MATVRAPRTAHDGAERQHVVVGRGIGFRRGDPFIHRRLHTRLQHPNLDRQISQALQTIVFVTVSRLRHSGRTIRDPSPPTQATLHRVDDVACALHGSTRVYTGTLLRTAFRNACQSGRRSSATATPHTQVFALVRRFHMTSSGSATSSSSMRNASGDCTVAPGAH
jgi:hypothetical protein